MKSADLLILFGNQLFPPSLLPEGSEVFMAEDKELCTYYRFHKHKIIFFLASMREHRDELVKAGHTVHYSQLSDTTLSSVASSETSHESSYEERLSTLVRRIKPDRLVAWEIEDKFMETRIVQLAKTLKVPLIFKTTPLFLTTIPELKKRLHGSGTVTLNG